MAAGLSIDVTGWLEEQLAEASPDLLRSMVQTFAEACGAGYGERRISGPIPATGTGGGSGIPGPARSTWRSRSCARAATSRTGCWSVGAVLAEQHDEWTEMRRYIGLDILAKSRLAVDAENTQPEEVTLTAITA